MFVIRKVDDEVYLVGSQSAPARDAQDIDGLVPLEFAKVYPMQRGAEKGVTYYEDFYNHQSFLYNRPSFKLEVVEVELTLK